MQNSNLKILCIVFTWFGKIHDIQVPLFSFNRSVENWTSNLQFEHGQLTEMTGARDYRLINRWVALHLRKHTPWKINGWNLQPSRNMIFRTPMIMFQPLIFQGVTDGTWSHHLEMKIRKIITSNAISPFLGEFSSRLVFGNSTQICNMCQLFFCLFCGRWQRLRWLSLTTGLLFVR